MMTYKNIFRKTLSLTVIGILCATFCAQNAMADYSSCIQGVHTTANKLTPPHNQKSDNCSVENCSNISNSNITSTISSLKSRDKAKDSCLSQMPIGNGSGLNISATVGIRTDTAALNGGDKTAKFKDGSRQHEGIDVGTAGQENVPLYAPAQAYYVNVKGSGTVTNVIEKNKIVKQKCSNGMSHVYLRHRRSSANTTAKGAQKNCRYYETRFYHLVNIRVKNSGPENPPTESSQRELGKGTQIGTAGGCSGYAIHMHYEIRDCDGTLFNPLCTSGGTGDPQQLCDGSDNVLPPTQTSVIENGTGSGNQNVNPNLGKKEDCCKYASESCKKPAEGATPAQTSNKIIYIGDSRTVGMASGKVTKTCAKKNGKDAFPCTVDGVGSDGNYWLAKEGEGLNWFTTNKSKVDGLLTNYGTILIALGVNDLHNADKYVSQINNAAKDWQAKGKKVYFSLALPVDEAKEASVGYSVKNADITAFNNKLKSGLSGVSVIDVSGSISSGSYSNDGLHYNSSTYTSLYNGMNQQMKSGGMGTAGGSGPDSGYCYSCTDKSDKQKECELRNQKIDEATYYCPPGVGDRAENKDSSNNKGGDGSYDASCKITKDASGKAVSPEIQQAIEDAAKIAGVSPAVMAGLLMQESGFGTNTGPSKAGAKGWAQIMPATWDWMVSQGKCSGSVNNPRDNILCGGHVLKYNLDLAKKDSRTNGDDVLERALTGYNWGYGNVQKMENSCKENWHSCIKNAEASGYAPKIMGHSNDFATKNGCSNIRTLYSGKNISAVPSGCEDFRWDSYGGNGSSAYGIATSYSGIKKDYNSNYRCNIAENYNDIKGCMFCDLFRVVFNTASSVAKKCHAIFASSMITLLCIGLAISLAFIVLRYVSDWTVKDPGMLLNDIFRKCFVVVFIILLLKIDVAEFFKMFVEPVFTTGFKLAELAISSSGTELPSIDWEINGEGLPDLMGLSMLRAIYAVQVRLEQLMALGSNSICIAFFVESYKGYPFFPHFGYLITGIFMWLIALVFTVIYPFLLLDSVLQFTIASALFPVALAATAFEITKKFLHISKVIFIFINSMFVFVFLTIILFILLAGIDEAVVDHIKRAYGESAEAGYFSLEQFGWYTRTFLKLLFFLFLGKSVLEDIPSFAEKWASAISQGGNLLPTGKGSIGRSVGGLYARSTTQLGLAAGVPLAKASARTLAKGGQAATRAVSNGIGTARRNYLINHTRKKAAALAADAPAGTRTANGEAWVSGRTWYGRKVMRRVTTDASGAAVLETKTRSLFGKNRTTTTSTDNISFKTKKNRDGTFSESYNIRSASMRSLINSDGTRNEAAYKEIMNTTGLTEEQKKKAILNSLLKERLAGTKGANLEGKFVKEQVISSKDDQGRDVFTVRRTDKDGNTHVYKMTKGDKRDLVEYEKISKDSKKSKKLSSDGLIQKKESYEYNLNEDGTMNLETSSVINGAEVQNTTVAADGMLRDKDGHLIGKVQANGNIIDQDGKVIGTTEVPSDMAFDSSGNALGKMTFDGKIVDAAGNVKGFLGDNGQIISNDGQSVLGAISAEQQNNFLNQISKSRKDRKVEFSHAKAYKGTKIFDDEGRSMGTGLENEMMLDEDDTALYKQQMKTYGDVLKHHAFGR